MTNTHRFEIDKWQVVRAYQLVKANKGAAGIDKQSMSDFEKDLKKVEDKMLELSRQKMEFTRKEVSKAEAISYFTEKEDPYYFVPGKETPLGQGDLPGIYWQPEAFTSSEGNEVEPVICPVPAK